MMVDVGKYTRIMEYLRSPEIFYIFAYPWVVLSTSTQLGHLYCCLQYLAIKWLTCQSTLKGAAILTNVFSVAERMYCSTNKADPPQQVTPYAIDYWRWASVISLGSGWVLRYSPDTDSNMVCPNLAVQCIPVRQFLFFHHTFSKDVFFASENNYEQGLLCELCPNHNCWSIHSFPRIIGLGRRLGCVSRLHWSFHLVMLTPARSNHRHALAVTGRW